MQFITFSGVDGSGKSTQLALLREKLEREGKKVAYFHAVDFSLANRLTKKNIENPCPTSRRGISNIENTDSGKSVTSASWFSIFLREIQLIIDLIRFRFYFSKIKCDGYDYLLSDRYFFDTIMNIEYLEAKCEHQDPRNDQLRGKFSILHSLYSILLCRPNKAFFFDANPEIIMRRERSPEQGIDYLRAKQELFKEKLSAWNLIPIDANKEKEIIFQEILKKI